MAKSTLLVTQHTYTHTNVRAAACERPGPVGGDDVDSGQLLTYGADGLDQVNGEVLASNVYRVILHGLRGPFRGMAGQNHCSTDRPPIELRSGRCQIGEDVAAWVLISATRGRFMTL